MILWVANKNMKLDVLDLSNKADALKYSNALISFGDKNPHYKLFFIQTFSNVIKTTYAFILLDDSDKELMLMPFHLKEVKSSKDQNQIYFDVLSTYGFSGPIYKKGTPTQIKQLFWKLVDDWYLQNNVITEFIRFNITGNYKEYTGVTVPTLSIVKGKLIPIDEQWDVYDRKVRQNIKKAQREGLNATIYHDIIPEFAVKEFYTIFEDTMIRNNADKRYYFGMENVLNYINSEPDDCVIITVYKGDLPISTELLIFSRTIMYSFLGGTISEYFNLRPNELLKHKIIDWGYKKNYKYYVLGGGHGSDDGIFKYKKTFFPNDIVKFHTGRKIINKVVFEELLEKSNINKDYEITSEGFFPPYLSN